MKKKISTLLILLLCSVSAIYSQVTFSGPSFVCAYNPTHGDFMDDATDASGKLWVIPDYTTNTVYEYTSMANLLTNTINTTYTLPFSFAGTGHIVWGGNLYYNKYNTNEMIKYNLATHTVLLDVALPNAGTMNTYCYNWGGYSDIDFAVDESGLWVMYSTAANTGKLVVSKLNSSTLAVTNTWNTNSEPKNQMGNAIVINGIVYCVDDYGIINQTVNYTYNTGTSTGAAASIPWTNGNSYMTSLQYNPVTHILYEWNNANLYTHNVLGLNTISNTVGAGPYCAGASVNVPFSLVGTFNGGNIFTAQLSDASGSFVSPVNIGSLTSTTTGTIVGTIPSNTTTSSLYRIRVIASNPVTTGADNGVNITINALPTVVANSTAAAVCSGSSVTLTGSGASTYAWSGGVTNAVSFVPLSTLTYTVTGTSSVGCTNTATTTVTVNPPPTVTANSTAAAVCVGNSVTLTGGGASTYTWSGGVTNGVAFVPVSTFTYTVTGTGANGCTNTATTTVTVNPFPTVVANSTAAAVCTGSSVTLSGSGASTYVWSGGVTNAVSFVPVSTLTYTVTGTSAAGCTNTATTTVTVNSLPTVTANSTAASVCAGNAVTLTGGGASTYSWTGGATDAVSFVPLSTLTYTVTGTGANGCTNTATTTVTVNPLPTVTANSTAASVCAGTSATLTGGGASTYAGSGGVTNAVSFVPVATLTYTVTGTGANGCTNTATTTVTVNPLPTVIGTATTTTACLPDASIALTGAPAGGTWSGSGVTASTFSPATAGVGAQTASYNYTDANGCSAVATVVITVNACTGVVDQNLSNGISIFPNPNNGTFNIAVDANVGDLTLIVTDMQGRVVYSSLENNVLSGFVKQISLDTQASGLYLLHIIANGEQKTQKISVQK